VGVAEGFGPAELSGVALHLEVLVALMVLVGEDCSVERRMADHLDLQKRKARASLRTKVMPFDGYTGAEQKEHVWEVLAQAFAI
jgi:hypothetical protein